MHPPHITPRTQVRLATGSLQRKVRAYRQQLSLMANDTGVIPELISLAESL